MAISVRGFNFSKRTNSTARPTIEDGQQYLCNFKQPTSIINPTIVVEGWDLTYNYATIAGDTERWYYVTDVRLLTNDLFEVDLKVDALATFRPNILATEAYVLRSGLVRNQDITDSFYPAVTGSSRRSYHEQFIPLANPGFILSVIGQDESAISNFTGVATYYIISETALCNLVKYIFDQDNFTDEIDDQVVKTFFNPSQYLISCMYCPFVSGGTGDTIKLGWWDTGISANKVSSVTPIALDEVEVTIPRVNDNAEHYQNYEPYSQYRLYIPYVGMVELSAHLLKGESTLRFNGYVDIPTGNMQMRVNGGTTGRLIATYEANCCASLPLAQSSLQLNTFSAVTGGLSILTDWIGGQFGNAVDDIADTITSAQRQVSINGNAGQMSQRSFIPDIYVILDYFSQVEKDYSEHGAPLCETRTLSELSGGYVKCLGANVRSTRATRSELDEIDNYLNTGVFLE